MPLRFTIRDLLWLTLAVALAVGCNNEKPPIQTPTFQFTIQDVFYIKPPVDRVIVTGTVDHGSIHAGDSASLLCKSGTLAVTVEGIEGFKIGELKVANAGDNVGLKLVGVTKDQPAPGDKVIAPARN